MNLTQLRTVVRRIERHKLLTPADLHALTEMAATGILLRDVTASPKAGAIGQQLKKLETLATECADQVLTP